MEKCTSLINVLSKSSALRLQNRRICFIN